MSGVQVGLLNISKGAMSGVQIGSTNGVGEADVSLDDRAPCMDGIQVGGFLNDVQGRMRGIQLSAGPLGGNSAGAIVGVQIGASLLPCASGDDDGTMFASNYALDVSGMQIGLWFNRAKSVHGMQIGLVNYCDSMVGVQIGLVNIITESSVPFFPIINAHF